MLKQTRKTLQRGFTLIELLVVIAIIAILSVVVFVALDPVTRFADARDARRFSDVNSILTATHEYIVDNDGALPPDFAAAAAATTSATFELCDTAATLTGACSTAGATFCIDASAPLAPYLKTIPVDPQNSTSTVSGYTVSIDENNLITVAACNGENTTVQVSR